MNPSSSGLSGGFAPYMYRPFDATRKRNQRSPFSEPERQSVLRDARGSAEPAGTTNKRLRYVLRMLAAISSIHRYLFSFCCSSL